MENIFQVQQLLSVVTFDNDIFPAAAGCRQTGCTLFHPPGQCWLPGPNGLIASPADPCAEQGSAATSDALHNIFAGQQLEWGCASELGIDPWGHHMPDNL